MTASERIREAREAAPYDGTRTVRRSIRQDIRRTLGNARSDPPGLVEVLYAARETARLLDLTSGGRYGLEIVGEEEEACTTYATPAGI